MKYRVGFAENFPEITPPNHKLPDFDGFVHWNEPMLYQVGSLQGKYVEWLETPTDRPLRLFKSDFVEFFSNTKWFVVPIVWLPVVYLLLTTASSALSLFSTIKVSFYQMENLLILLMARRVDMETLESTNHESLSCFLTLRVRSEKISRLESASSRVVTHQHSLSA